MNFRDKLKNHKRIVLKIGTTSLTLNNGKINTNTIESLSKIAKELMANDKEIIVVTSGAVALGKAILNIDKKIEEDIDRQVASSIGQASLISSFMDTFSKQNIKIGQFLITKDMFKTDILKENLKYSLETLLSSNIVPIINENDAILTKHISGFTNNDTLSAHISSIISADILIILSDIDGMYDKDPHKYDDAKMLDTIFKIDKQIEDSAGDTVSEFGSGGMKTKVEAYKIVSKYGIDMVIASGKDINIIKNILQGENIGTLFTCDNTL